MQKITLTILFVLFFTICKRIHAQSQTEIRSAISIESRITNLLQGGYEGSLFFNAKNHFSFGVQFAAQDIEGRAKELLFDSDNFEELEIRIPWLIGIKTRYHLKSHKEGVYIELSAGTEQFRITSEEETQRNNNGFILPSVGYLWHPWWRSGFYINPNVGYIYAFSRESERTINGTTYELRSFFPSAAVSVGWKFNQAFR